MSCDIGEYILNCEPRKAVAGVKELWVANRSAFGTFTFDNLEIIENQEDNLGENFRQIYHRTFDTSFSQELTRLPSPIWTLNLNIFINKYDEFSRLFLERFVYSKDYIIVIKDYNDQYFVFGEVYTPRVTSWISNFSSKSDSASSENIVLQVRQDWPIRLIDPTFFDDFINNKTFCEYFWSELCNLSWSQYCAIPY